MQNKWFYLGEEYDSESAVEAAVTDTKNRLENNPTDWVEVKQVEVTEAGSLLVPSKLMTDEEINNISDEGVYNVASVIDGHTFTGVTGAEAKELISDMRTRYAQWLRVDVLTKEYAPTNEDMSGYV